MDGLSPTSLLTIELFSRTTCIFAEISLRLKHAQWLPLSAHGEAGSKCIEYE